MQSIQRSARFWAALVLPLALLAAPPARKAPPWYLKPVVRPEVPAALSQSTNPIDAFIAAKLKDKGLRATGPADKATLLRRVYLDLIGVPPTPAEQDAFLADATPGAC